ncbi:MAG: DegV family protein [Bacteroidota bacterium]|nr:DegV family protein [Bacteroidota bacterium]
MDTTSQLTLIDGNKWYYGFLSGAKKIIENQKHINKINVFPVPDGDTGTNLASTLRSIIDNTTPHSSCERTAESIADAALEGARGNSGIIFAQFLYGISNGMKDKEKIDIRTFAEIMLDSVKYAYDAIANPIEGTMISVIKAWAEFLYYIKDSADDFIKFLLAGLEKAKEALIKTTTQLKALAKMNVVDAGAQGFVMFLEGMLEFLISGIKADVGKVTIEEDQTIDSIQHEEITFRYCTEALFSGEKLDKHGIRDQIIHLGDSVAVAGSPEKLRVHIHTDHPEKVLARLSKQGVIISQKVDDMVMQNEVIQNRRHPVALMTDSTCDLPKEWMDEHQIHFVSLNLFLDGNQYLDKVTMTADQFYDMMDKSPDFPTTSQPSITDITNKFNFLTTHYDSVIAVHASSGLSGTYSNSFTAADKISSQSGKKISVVDSQALTGTLGLLMYRAALALDEGISHDELVLKIEEWKKKTLLYVNPYTMKNFVRGGRVSKTKGFIAKILNVKPVISMKDGVADILDKAYSLKANQRMVLRYVDKAIKEQGKIWKYCIVHANNIAGAKSFGEKVEALVGMEPAYYYNISPVVGVNGGTNTLAVCMMFE